MAEENRGDNYSIYLHDNVLKALDRVATCNERSRSWMIESILKEKLGIPTKPEDGK